MITSYTLMTKSHHGHICIHFNMAPLFFFVYPLTQCLILVLILGPPSAPVGPIKTLQVTRDSATIQWQPPTSDGGSPLTGKFVNIFL